MKKLMNLLFVLLLFASCEKVEITNMTGTLKVTCHLANEDYENIQIAIYSAENTNYALNFGQPDAEGVYNKELLQGNYQIEIYYSGQNSSTVRAVQIIGDHTSTINVEW